MTEKDTPQPNFTFDYEVIETLAGYVNSESESDYEVLATYTVQAHGSLILYEDKSNETPCVGLSDYIENYDLMEVAHEIQNENENLHIVYYNDDDDESYETLEVADEFQFEWENNVETYTLQEDESLTHVVPDDVLLNHILWCESLSFYSGDTT